MRFRETNPQVDYCCTLIDFKLIGRDGGNDLAQVYLASSFGSIELKVQIRICYPRSMQLYWRATLRELQRYGRNLIHIHS